MAEHKYWSDLLLDALEVGVEGGPFEEIEEVEVTERVTGENASVRMMNVVVDGETYLVQAKRVGGER